MRQSFESNEGTGNFIGQEDFLINFAQYMYNRKKKTEELQYDAQFTDFWMITFKDTGMYEIWSYHIEMMTPVSCWFISYVIIVVILFQNDEWFQMHHA